MVESGYHFINAPTHSWVDTIFRSAYKTLYTKTSFVQEWKDTEPKRTTSSKHRHSLAHRTCHCRFVENLASAYMRNPTSSSLFRLVQVSFSGFSVQSATPIKKIRFSTNGFENWRNGELMSQASCAAFPFLKQPNISWDMVHWMKKSPKKHFCKTRKSASWCHRISTKTYQIPLPSMSLSRVHPIEQMSTVEPFFILKIELERVSPSWLGGHFGPS